MYIIWVCIPTLLAFSLVFSEENTSNITFFPAPNRSIAGVILVSYLAQNQPQYAFNVSEARKICQSLGLSIASKAQLKEALSRGLETCRFGWTDEQIAVIPRITASANCGKNQTGLVTWRAAVTFKFDVFCFSESDALVQLENEETGKRLRSSELIHTANSTLTSQSTSSSSTHSLSLTSAPETMSNEVESARFVSRAEGSAGSNVVLVTCICGLLLSLMAVLAYFKMGRHWHLCSNKKQQEVYTQTEEWISVKTTAETTTEIKEDMRIEVDDGAE